MEALLNKDKESGDPDADGEDKGEEEDEDQCTCTAILYRSSMVSIVMYTTRKILSLKTVVEVSLFFWTIMKSINKLIKT